MTVVYASFVLGKTESGRSLEIGSSEQTMLC